eukprot:UN32753
MNSYGAGLPTAGNLANGLQLLITLRVISYAYDCTSKRNDIKNIALSSSFIEYFAFCYFFMGCFTGPFYPYHTFKSIFENKSYDIDWEK